MCRLSQTVRLGQTESLEVMIMFICIIYYFNGSQNNNYYYNYGLVYMCVEPLLRYNYIKFIVFKLINGCRYVYLT